MYDILQWIGGGFYLLNKIFLSFSEHSKTKGDQKKYRGWRIASWAVYLVGLPPWVIIFIHKHRWIAASVEASGAPAMLLGLVIAMRGQDKDPPPWLDNLALACISLGFGYSLYDFGGITTFNQCLEIGLVSGFLFGTYLLAKEEMKGYLWYVLMHITCGWLVWRDGYPWLALQQAVSLIFIVDAYFTAKARKKVSITA